MLLSLDSTLRAAAEAHRLPPQIISTPLASRAQHPFLRFCHVQTLNPRIRLFNERCAAGHAILPTGRH